MAAFERRAFLVLLLVMLVLTFIRQRPPVPWEPWPVARFESLVEQLERSDRSEGSTVISSLSAGFDPNSASYDEMVRAGVRPKLARNIVSYREKIGAFRSVEEVGRLYSIHTGEFEALRPHLLLAPSSTVDAPTLHDPGETPPCQPIPINSTTDSALAQDLGLKLALAGRIIAYRELLGGYVNVSQLAEVYGMPKGVLERITPCLLIDSSSVRMLDLNLMSFKELLRHPYLDLASVKAIVAHRKKERIQGHQLLQLGILDSVQIRRISPYIL